jgi:ribonuclease D
MNLITTNDALIEACNALMNDEFIAVDTEFMRETTYWPKLCLIQVAGVGVDFALDPLADGINLEPLLELMRNTAILKVFHAPRQDLEIFYRLMNGKLPSPIFDTQIAAMALGLGEQTAYDNLVMAILGHHVDKSSRFTDWARRPLSEAQIKYAIHDVTFLRDLFPKLLEKLDSLGRRAWVEEEMKSHTIIESYDQTPTNAWKRMKPRKFSAEYLAAFFAVTTWREWFAQEKDIPRGRALKDDAIYEIAEQKPRTAEAMEKLRAVPKGFARSKGGEALVEALNEALETPEEFAPKVHKPKPNPNGIGAIVELLKVLLRAVSEELDVAPRLIATVSDLEAIAIDDNADCETLKGWRKEIFGDKAIMLKHGKISLSIQNRKVTMVETIVTSEINN